MTEKSKKRRLRWDGTQGTTPSHPYRDSAIMYAILAAAVIGVTALTDGNMRAALIIAPVLFVIATGYSWWRWRQRQRREQQEVEGE